MPPQKRKKNPNYIDQDMYGYISPSLQRVRDIPFAQRTPAQQEFANLAERRGLARRQREINTPVDPTNQGRPSIASRNNNSGNLRMAGQLGATKDPESGFARFESPTIGFLALERQMRRYKENNMTLEQMVNAYAPPHENNTAEYLQRMERLTGSRGNTNLRYIKTEDLAKAIALLESGTTVNNRNPINDERPRRNLF
jgi:hypothetical protein